MQTQVSTGLELVLNGRTISIDGVPSHATLLDLLRARGLTGAKEGCAEGECGACTVVLVASSVASNAASNAAVDASSEYRPVNSCLMLASMAAGHEIYTVESLAQNGALAPAQSAMAAAGGSQCGYCTPGFVMSLFAEHYRPGRTGPCDPYQLGGNLCRCTGYRPIRDAALSLGPPPPGPFLDRLSKPAPRLAAASLSRNGFHFSRPATLDDCLSILDQDPHARVISGGTDLVVESNLRRKRWTHLVSTEALPELRQFTETTASITIGAGLSLNEIARYWHTPPACFTEWIPLFASPPLRNRATLGGNLATASPIGDGAPLLLALDAQLHLARKNQQRTIPLAAFFTGYRRTALAPGEIITAIEIPKPLPAVTRFFKVSKRRMDDISTVAASMALDFDASRRIARARFAFGGVAAVPLRALAAEEQAVGERWNSSTVARVQNAVEQHLNPIGDHRGSADYRRAVAGSLVEKFWWERPEAA